MNGKKILVIDDEDHILNMIKNRLKANGYEVIAVSNGLDGLEAAKTGSPDLIILDVMLPDINGKEVCLRLKEHESTAKIPVIFLTAKDSIEEKMEEYDCGGECHITKPFDANELLEKIKRTLEDIREFEQREE
ncbi:MAG: response regulator [Candidatus Aureabacteria bacterium]|nr:response regulator [Candidatus Auribacterota bacterium]